jgi:hypothetical protein
LEYLRKENTKIQLQGAGQSDTWLYEPLLVKHHEEARIKAIEAGKLALLSDFRHFASSSEIIDTSVAGIGGRGWKSIKERAVYTLRKQQEKYQRINAKKEELLKELGMLKGFRNRTMSAKA